MSSPETIAAATEALGDRAVRDWPTAEASTYRVGWSAALMLVADDVADLRFLADVVRDTGIDVLVVGNGSNLLVSDAGFPGVAVRLGGGMTGVEVEDTTVTAGGAALLPGFPAGWLRSALRVSSGRLGFPVFIAVAV